MKIKTDTHPTKIKISNHLNMAQNKCKKILFKIFFKV